MKNAVHSATSKTLRFAKKYSSKALTAVLIVGTAITTYQKEAEKLNRVATIGSFDDE